MKKTNFLLLPVLFTLSLLSPKESKTNVHAEWVDEREMNDYINSHIPSGWYKAGSIIDVTYQDGNGNYYTEKCQTITTDLLKYDNQVVATERISPNLVSGGSYSFTLSYKEITSTSNVSGGFFNGGGGVGGNISTPFFEVFSTEFTVNYTFETTTKNTFEEATSVSYNISTKQSGTWQLTKCRVLEQYKVMRFTKQERYRQDPIYDSKGNFLRYEKVFDHYYYGHSQDEEFTILKDQYFRIFK